MKNISRMWVIKSCPKCGGDLFVDPYDPKDLKCLQCGRSLYQRTEEEKRALREEVSTGRKVRLP